MTEITVDPTMVEKVAKAIWSENQPAGAPAYDELDFLDQGRVKMIARACIKAMREPTPEMLGYEPLAAVELAKVWESLIDKALKED
jgi:hypothetical protein